MVNTSTWSGDCFALSTLSTIGLISITRSPAIAAYTAVVTSDATVYSAYGRAYNRSRQVRLIVPISASRPDPARSSAYRSLQPFYWFFAGIKRSRSAIARTKSTAGTPCFQLTTSNQQLATSSSRHVAVRRGHAVALGLQPLLHLFRDKHRPVLPAGASERHRQIALPFLNVMRQQKLQHVRHLVQKLLRLRKLEDVLRHFGIPPGQFAERRHKVRVGQKAHVEHQVGLCRNAVLEAEADRRNGQVARARASLKLRQNVRAQLVYVELRRVQHHVGDVADGVEPLAFGAYALRHGLAAHRVRPPRLGKPAHQRLFVRLQEYHAGRKRLSHLLQNRRKAVQPRRLAHIHHQRRARNLGRLPHQVGKAWNQFQRQVVHRVVAEVIKRLQRRQLPRAGHPGQNHQLVVARWTGSLPHRLRTALRGHGEILAPPLRRLPRPYALAAAAAGPSRPSTVSSGRGCRLPVVVFCFWRTACCSIFASASRSAIVISADSQAATMCWPPWLTVTSAILRYLSTDSTTFALVAPLMILVMRCIPTLA